MIAQPDCAMGRGAATPDGRYNGATPMPGSRLSMFTLTHLTTPPPESLKSQVLQMVVDYFSDLSPAPLTSSNPLYQLYQYVIGYEVHLYLQAMGSEVSQQGKQLGNKLSEQGSKLSKQGKQLGKELKEDVTQISGKHKEQLSETFKRSKEHTLEAWKKVVPVKADITDKTTDLKS